MPVTGKTITHIYESLYRKYIWDIHIPILLQIFGITVDVFRKPKDIYQEVYGIDSGTDGKQVSSIKALLLGDEYVPTDLRNVGTFKEGWIYFKQTDYIPGPTPNIKEGDVIRFQRQDGKVRRYKVEELNTIGSTIQIIQRFKISSLGD